MVLLATNQNNAVGIVRRGFAPMMAKASTEPWWVTLIRREGILTVLVIAYAYWVILPESRDRREALLAYRQATAHITQALDRMDEADRIKIKMLTEVEAALALNKEEHRLQLQQGSLILGRIPPVKGE